MKIALVVPGLGIGGAERIACGLCDHLASNGHEVKLFCLTNKVLLRPSDPAVSIQVYEFSRHKILSLPSRFAHFRRDLLAFAPDIVNTHLAHGNLFGRLANGTLHGPSHPLVSTIHNNRAPGSFVGWLYRLTDNLSAKTVAVSEEARAVFVRSGACPPTKAGVILNGIAAPAMPRPMDAAERRDLRTRLGANDEEFLLLAIGRAVEEKDYLGMLKSLALAARTDPRLKLAVVGGGPELAHLVAATQDMKLGERVTFLGEQPDAQRYLAAADAFISTSTIEGFGLAIGEAMAAGLPVIAPRTGGVPNLVGDTGWLCPPGDPDCFAQRLIEVAAIDQADRQQIGLRARARIIEHFSEFAMHRAWEALLMNVANAPPTNEDHV